MWRKRMCISGGAKLIKGDWNVKEWEEDRVACFKDFNHQLHNGHVLDVQTVELTW